MTAPRCARAVAARREPRARSRRGGALLATAFALCSCALRISVDYEPLMAAPQPEPRAEAAAIELYPAYPERPHRELGILRARGRAPVDILRFHLRQKAGEVHADAVIRVRVSEREPDRLPAWLAWLNVGLEPTRLLQGTAVVFTDGEAVRHPPAWQPADRPEAGGGP